MKELNKAKGAYGEDLACRELEKNGYVILERNYRYRNGEIDIIAEKDGIIIFVEVKFRTSTKNGMPCGAVDFKKQKKIINTALMYIQQKNLLDSSFRFDVIEVLALDTVKIRHIKNAFWE